MFRVKLALAGATLLTIISTCYGQESLANGDRNSSRSCNIAPLGIGRDDTDQVQRVSFASQTTADFSSVRS